MPEIEATEATKVSEAIGQYHEFVENTVFIADAEVK